MYCCLIPPCPSKQNSINTNKDLVFSKARKVADLPDQDLGAVLQSLWVGSPFPSSPAAHCHSYNVWLFFFLGFSCYHAGRKMIYELGLFVECLSIFFFRTESFSVPSWPPKGRLVCVLEYGLAGTTLCWCCTWTEEGFFLLNLGCFPINFRVRKSRFSHTSKSFTRRRDSMLNLSIRYKWALAEDAHTTNVFFKLLK